MGTRSKSKSIEDEPKEENPTEILRILKKMDKNIQDLKAGQVNVEAKLEALGSKFDRRQSEIR